MSYKVILRSLNQKNEQHKLKKIVVLVSVGQAYHEGDKFKATIKKISKLAPDLCTIMLADTLQRYNYHAHFSKEKALDIALTQGSEWIQRNKSALMNTGMNFEINRWNDYLSHPLYTENKKMILRQYKEDSSYQNSIHSTIGKFLNRKQIQPSYSYQDCLDYLLEECPIIMPMAAQLEYDAIIYPKPMTTAMNHTHEKFVKHQFNKDLDWLHIKFKKKKYSHDILSHDLAIVEN